ASRAPRVLDGLRAVPSEVTPLRREVIVMLGRPHRFVAATTFGRRVLAGAPALSVAVAVGVVAGAAPAFAVDATGTWSGRSICRQRSGTGVGGAIRRDSTLLITQRDEALFIEIDGAAYGGTSRESRRKPTHATGRAVRGDDAAGGVLECRMDVDEARGTTSLNAESPVHDASGRWHCRYRFARTSRDDP